MTYFSPATPSKGDFPALDLLAQQQLLATLQQHCSVADQPACVLYQSQTQSTNDDALRLAQLGYTTALVVSQTQTQGRGQQQRSWHSVEGNLFLSILLPLQRAIDGRFALECAYHLLHTPPFQPLLQQNQLQIKWANDLYSPQGKWGGILIEPISRHQVIIGIGINLIACESPSIQQPITSLAQLGLKHHLDQKNTLICQIYQMILNAKADFELDCLHLAHRLQPYLAFKHKMVQLQRQFEMIQGTLIGIQADGAVLIQQPNQHIQAYYDGRLSLV